MVNSIKRRKIDDGPYSCWNNVRNYFLEYCDNSSIHGFKYLGERRRTLAEKFWWIVAFSVCLSVCIFLILRMYDTWQKAPVIVSFATKETPIYQIPFPAVTICPESKSNRKLLNYTKMWLNRTKGKKLSSEDEKKFEYISLICNDKPEGRNPRFRFHRNSTEFYRTMDSVAPKVDTIFHGCSWMGEKFNCRDIFTPILTDDGVCYTFNFLDRSELFRDDVYRYGDYIRVNISSMNWSLEAGYSETEEIDTYPRRALLAGARNALTMTLLTPKADIDYTCKNGLQGFKVVLHIPQRLPRVTQQYFRIPLDQAVLAAIHPSMMKTSDDVKRYQPHKRECFFPSERYLRYFKIYTQLNCQMECMANFTYDSCGCVNFYMPRTNRMPICGTGKVQCMQDAEKDILIGSLQQKLSKEIKSEEDNRTIEAIMDCDCLPICADLSYNTETSQTDWDWVEQYKAMGINTTIYNKDLYHLSSLTLFFKSGHFITSERNELYGPTAFIANFGGLIGLVTGFSMLSIVELIYFLTLRICCNLKIYGYKNWAGYNDE